MACIAAIVALESCASSCSGLHDPHVVAAYDVPDSGDFLSMTTGPDNALWFTDIEANSIGRIDPTARTMRRFPLPNPASNPMGIAVGPDGNLWFAEEGRSVIGRVSTAGEFKEFASPWGRIDPYTLTAGPDGALWFEIFTGAIGRVTTGGRFDRFPLPHPDSDIRWMTTGPDGALWLVDVRNGNFDRMTTRGTVAEFSLPDGAPRSIVACPDGHLWMSSYGYTGTREAYRVYRVSPDGSAVKYRLPNPDATQEATAPTPTPLPLIVRACPGGKCGERVWQSKPFGIAGCFRDDVWFWIGSNIVGRIDIRNGSIQEYGLAAPPLLKFSSPRGRIVWFHDERSRKMYEVEVP